MALCAKGLRVEQNFTQPAGALADDQASYTLTAKASGTPMPSGSADGVYAFTVSGTDHIELPAISFPAYGTYVYEIAQATPAATGYTYDNEVYTVTVYYEASYMELITTNRAGQKVTVIQFSHAYAPLPTDPALMTYPPVKLTVQGSPGRPSTFSFMLTADNMENPMPADSRDRTKTVSITGSGEASFGAWSYTKTGVYYYTVAQIDTKIKGYTYDMAVYTITDTVKEVDGQLILTRVVKNSAGKPVQTCLYINQYTGPADGSAPTNNGNGSKGSVGSQIGNGPKTGDDANLFALIMRLILSSLTAVGCAAYLINDKRRKKNADAEYRMQHE